VLVSVRSFFLRRHFTNHMKRSPSASASASAGRSSITNGPIMANGGFPRSSKDRRGYAPARSRIAIARGRRFQARDRRIGASLRLTSRCDAQSPITKWAAGATPTFVSLQLSPNGSVRSIVSSSGHPRLSGEHAQDMHAKKIHFDTYQLPTKRMKATIITYSAPVSIQQSTRERGRKYYCSILYAVGAITGTLVRGVGTVDHLARSHTSADDHSRRVKDTQQQSSLIGSWYTLIIICVIGNMIGPLCFGRNNIILRCYCYFT